MPHTGKIPKFIEDRTLLFIARHDGVATASDVYQHLRIRTSLMGVYRAISSLTKRGLITRKIKATATRNEALIAALADRIAESFPVSATETTTDRQIDVLPGKASHGITACDRRWSAIAVQTYSLTNRGHVFFKAANRRQRLR